MTNILIFIWQLPQNMLGLILFGLFRHDARTADYRGIRVMRSPKMKGGISLGYYVIVSRHASETTVLHEWGHTRQSLMLGWLYFLIIGIPSFGWATSRTLFPALKKRNYYSFYTEKWADRLAGIKRKQKLKRNDDRKIGT